MTDNPTHDLSVHNQWGERYIFMGAMLVTWMFGKLRCGIAGPNPLPGRALTDAVQKIDPGYCLDAPDTFPAGGMRSDSVEFEDDGPIAVPMQLTVERG